VVGIDHRTIAGAVAEGVWTVSAAAMRHTGRHEHAVEVTRVAHGLHHLAVVVEPVLRRNGGIGPSGILDELAAARLESLKSGFTELRIGCKVARAMLSCATTSTAR
jgi:hypothetical protein